MAIAWAKVDGASDGDLDGGYKVLRCDKDGYVLVRVIYDWRPIATAPRDGTEVLLFGRLENADPWWEVGFWGENISEEYGWTEGRDRSLLRPTHWQSLVAPEEGK